MKKLSRSTRQYIIVAIICLIVIGGAGILAYILTTSKMKETLEGRIAAANRTIQENTRMVYVAKADIISGNLLTEENTEYKSVFSSQAEEIFIDEFDIGKKALVTIPAGMQITKSYVADADIMTNLRETNYSVIKNSRNIISNDTVDVRLLYPNGENVIVLAKKTIKDMTENNMDCYFWLSEEEILLMSSAIVDAYQYEGAELYTTEYIEPSIQEASVINYTPSQQTINLIANDPNIIEIATKYLSTRVRSQLEKRLADTIIYNNNSVNSESSTSDDTLYIEENTDNIIGPTYKSSETSSGTTESGSGLYAPTYDSDSQADGIEENYFEIGDEGGKDLG